MFRQNTVLAIFIIVVSGLHQGCDSTPVGDTASRVDSVIDPIGPLTFFGAFALPVAADRVSSLNYPTGVIETNGDSLFIVGHRQDDAIAEFNIPEIIASTRVSELAVATRRQGFVRILERARAGNPESLDEIVGLELAGSQLIINAVQYYDGPANNVLSTLVVDNGFDLQRSDVSQFRAMQGSTRAAGWISSIPESNRAQLGGTHISGASSGGPIIARYSVGPSAFVLDFESIRVSDSSTIQSEEILGFHLDKPLANDLYNDSRSNRLWTHLSQARYGFIVPGTSTYLTIGYSGGHQSGVGYKIVQDNGNLCGGFCSYNVADNYNYFWLWDLADMIEVKNGAVTASDIRPLDYGYLYLPFQVGGTLSRIGGASFDPTRNILYISLLRTNNNASVSSAPPLIVAYKLEP